ncbi:hypothetical protein [Micromonospora sp. KC213]|uniref:hypothetical protein n=1 Tax=Micromonospora sp. KC213 TaxID=2530378 RepID=UPI00326140C2
MVAAWFGVHRSTITRSVAEVRPLLAERGCRVHDGVRRNCQYLWMGSSCWAATDAIGHSTGQLLISLGPAIYPLPRF